MVDTNTMYGRDAVQFDNVPQMETLNVTMSNPECAVWWAHAWMADSSSRQKFMTANHHVYLRCEMSIKKPYFSLANGILHIYSTEEELATMVHCLCPYFRVTVAVYCLRVSNNIMLKFPAVKGIWYTAEQIIQGNPFNDLVQHASLLRVICNSSLVITNIHKNPNYTFGQWALTPLTQQLTQQLSMLCKKGVVCTKNVWIDIPLPDYLIHTVLKVFPQVKSLIVIAAGAKPHIPGVTVKVFDPVTRHVN